jgi:hypothetical protein
MMPCPASAHWRTTPPWLADKGPTPAPRPPLRSQQLPAAEVLVALANRDAAVLAQVLQRAGAHGGPGSRARRTGCAGCRRCAGPSHGLRAPAPPGCRAGSLPRPGPPAGPAAPAATPARVLRGQGRQCRAQVPAAKAGAAAQAQQARRRRPLLRQGLAQQVHLLGDAPRPCSTISPWAVSVIRRVERWNRRTCRPASSKAMRLLMRALKPQRARRAGKARWRHLAEQAQILQCGSDFSVHDSCPQNPHQPPLCV